MPSDAELLFADHMGRFYARRYAYAPMVGRLIGYLAVCDPPAQTVADLAEALLASRSAITGAVKTLEAVGTIRRARSAGERMDRVCLDMSTDKALGFDLSEYEELADMAREGLGVLADAPVERRAPLLEMAAFAEFLTDRIAAMRDEWFEHRAALIASGELPAEPPRPTRGRA